MKLKKITNCLAMFLALLGVLGGCGMGKNEIEVDIKKEQVRMVNYLSDHYKNVEKVEFTSFEKNDMTGTWRSDAVINGIYYITFNLNGIDGEIDITEHISKSNGRELSIRTAQRNVDVSEIKVIYFEE